MSVDLAALVNDREAKGVRSMVKHPVCLDDDAFAELELAQAEKEAAEDETSTDVRLSSRDALSRRIKDLQKRVEETSVMVVFRVPTRRRQGELLDLTVERAKAASSDSDDDADDEKPDEPDLDLMLLTECFWRFERYQEPVAELSAEHWAKIWPSLATGEQNTIARRIWDRSTGRPDFPKLVRQSLLTRK